MFEVLFKHIIGEQAITAFFDNIMRNFNTTKIWCNVGDKVTCCFYKNEKFTYISQGEVSGISDTKLQIKFNKTYFDLESNVGTLITELIDINFESIHYFQVINNAHFKTPHL